MGKTLFSLTFATVLLALASSEASAFLYSSFVCQAVGARSVGWGRSFFIGEAKVIALSRCARRSGIFNRGMAPRTGCAPIAGVRPAASRKFTKFEPGKSLASLPVIKLRSAM